MHTKQQKNYPAWLDFIPLILFFTLNKYFDIYIATVALMISASLNIVLGYIISKQLNYVSIVSVILVIIFGSLTVYLQNEDFIKIKVTLINIFIALILLVGLLLRKNFLKMLFNKHFQLNNKGWLILNIMWIIFFSTLAVLNEVIWRNLDTQTWVNFKVFGIIILTFIFTILTIPLVSKYKQN